MYREFGGLVKKPPNEAKIWQYMDIAKLVSILDREELYFTNTDTFIDPYEGTLAEYNKIDTVRLQRFNDELKDVDDDMIKSLILKPPETVLQTYRDRLLVNCWHLNDGESAAMWDLYSNRKAGIAIQSTYRRLRDSFTKAIESIGIGMVQYMDYNTQWMEEDLFRPFLTKRLSFKHEQELRAFTIIYDNDLSKDEIPRNITPSLPTVGKAIKRTKGQPPIHVKGRYIKVGLDQLIEKIYVAPMSADYLKEVMKSILTKYSLPNNLLQISDLYSLR